MFPKQLSELDMVTMNSQLCLLVNECPVAFMDLINRVFLDYLDSFMIVLIDDILYTPRMKMRTRLT